MEKMDKAMEGVLEYLKRKGKLTELENDILLATQICQSCPGRVLLAVPELGFAIPISEAKTILDDLIVNGYVSGRVSLGLTVSEF